MPENIAAALAANETKNQTTKKTRGKSSRRIRTIRKSDGGRGGVAAGKR